MTSEYKIRYDGSLLWVVFWLLVYFPVALMLFFTNAYFRSDDTVYRLYYNGSRFWLGFWIIVFFPIALVLVLCKGLTWVASRDV